MKQLLSIEFKIFGGLVLAWALACFCFLLDQVFGGRYLPNGLLTVLMECALEVMAIASLISSGDYKKQGLKYFFLMFCFLLQADFFYLIVHYAVKMNNGMVTFLVTTLPYCTAYSFGSIGFCMFLRGQLAPAIKAKPLSIIWLPVLFSVPVLFTILIPLMFSHYHTGGWNFLLFERVFDSVFAMTFFFVAVIAFAFSTNKVISFLALGGILIQLGNWGICSALLNGNQYSLTEYEFLWLCGIVSLWYSVFFLLKLPVNRLSFEQDGHDKGSYQKSLIVQQRQIVITLISITILIAVSVLQRNIWSYRIAFFGVAIGCFVSLFLGEILAKQIVYYSTLFGKIVKHSAVDESVEAEKKEIPLELWQIYQSAFHGEMIQHRVNVAVRESVGQLAAQVAHDIRSPIAALDNVVGNIKLLPEDDRVLVRTAVNRIKDIANNLIEKNREVRNATKTHGHISPTASTTSEVAIVQLLSSLVDPLITEKRMQFRSKIGIDIDGRIDASSYGLFASIQPTEFKRVLSNLVNNAVEALGDKGTVMLTLTGKSGQISIMVRDNGRGISAELLARLGSRGETHGKQGGSGLGLYHARTSVEGWGGKLKLVSEVGKGTTVEISLPQAAAPHWFVSELKLVPHTAIVILDDDASIHGIWQGRFDSMTVMARGITVVHISTPDEFKKWVNDNHGAAKAALYLVDFELLGFKETGLDLVQSLGVSNQTILVTSRFDEKHIRDGCERLKVRLIPKGMAGFVPISFEQGQGLHTDLL